MKNGDTTHDGQEIANCLNDYFYEVFELDDGTSPLSQIETLIKEEFVIDLNEFNSDAVFGVLNKLIKNKSMVVDGVHPHVLKECAKKFSIPLSEVFNSSISHQYLRRVEV